MNDTSDRVNFEAVQVALEKVTILEAAAAMGMQLKMGAQKSPFREDKKPSFSVFQGGRFFKDHANPEHSGGLMKFLMLAQPGWQKRDRVTFAMRLAGLDPNGPAPRHVPLKRSSRTKPKWKPLPIMPESVSARYVSGYGADGLDECRELQERCARERGWPVEWVAELARKGKASYPALPWDDGKRGVAFLVEQPELVVDAIRLMPVGYHQRFWVEKRKSWCFVPYEPSNVKTAFQKTLKGKVHPYPFVAVMNDLETVWITEGQWDAWTLACVLGLDSPYTVLGLRGASSGEVFLNAWLPLIRFRTKEIIIVGDSDAAGAAVWDLRQSGSLASRIRKAGIAVITAAFNMPGVKDFNDYYKRNPSVTRKEVESWVK